MKNIISLLLFLILFSCAKYDTKWEEIKGVGVMEGEILHHAIYFQDSLKGIIGGYKSIYNTDSSNPDKPINIPVLYLTKNAGKEWKPVKIVNVKIEEYLNIVNNVKLMDNLIVCQIGSLVLESNDLGLTWNVIEKSNRKDISDKYFPNSNQYDIQNKKFEFQNKKYITKESYKYENIEVIICYDEERLMTDHYYISKDNGNTWEFLQSEFGSNKRKFLLKDEYLFAFDSQYGLQKLKLK